MWYTSKPANPYLTITYSTLLFLSADNEALNQMP